ncbi:hypothetical protein NA56DRAFT_651998 [Hyaloscypha hepaticicola]|uniref:Uncharacterized protein n=1 Tax=Hyaloscypha hepaticicola TaxID=2082293 RepID=A0A2J6PGD4_9HELO|nr:hypothetical protein NA56DRAFT_651998 [Hyaloscypha hepaticicola]
MFCMHLIANTQPHYNPLVDPTEYAPCICIIFVLPHQRIALTTSKPSTDSTAIYREPCISDSFTDEN